MPSDIEIRTDKVALLVPKFKEGALTALALCTKKSKEFDKANSVAWECCDLVKETRQQIGKAKDAKAKKDLEDRLKGAEAQFKKFIDGRKRIAEEFTDAAATALKLVGPVGGLVDEIEKLQTALPRSAVDGDPRDVAEKLKTAHVEATSLKDKLGKAAQSATGLPKAPTI